MIQAASQAAEAADDSVETFALKTQRSEAQVMQCTAVQFFLQKLGFNVWSLVHEEVGRLFGRCQEVGGKTIFDSRDWHRIFSFSDGLGILCWGHLQVLGTNKTIDEETSHEPQTLGSDDEFPTGNGRFFIVFPHLLEFDVELWASGPFLFPESDAFLSDVPWWKT